MHWLLIGYMFLFIHRPFEVWPVLGDLHIERVYMAATLVVWAISPGKRWLANPQHAAYAGLAAVVLACWAVSPWADQGQPVVEDWFKILVFYVLLVTTVHDERGLKRLVVGFLAVMALYLTHSLREYMGGRFTYRMGISRMIGVDRTLGDPNSFGASIVFALPFVTALWRTDFGGRWGKFALVGYTGLSVLCILLTGSRSSLLGLAAWAGVISFGLQRRWMWIGLAALAAPVVFLALPESLQTRFETIVNPDVGPANAKESGEGRLQGFLTGLDLWSANPLAGIGPGSWRPATGSPLESHNLYGQLMGELGTVGIVAFAALLLCFWLNWRRVHAVRKQFPEWTNDFPFQVSAAVGTSVLLLLFMGNFGHNLFRFSWLWYGGFLIIARYCVESRLRDLPDEEECEETDDTDGPPEGWEAHPGHASPTSPT